MRLYDKVLYEKLLGGYLIRHGCQEIDVVCNFSLLFMSIGIEFDATRMLLFQRLEKGINICFNHGETLCMLYFLFPLIHHIGRTNKAAHVIKT